MLNVVGIVFLVLILINFLLGTALTVLNLRHLRGKAASLPAVFEPYVDVSTYQKSVAYNADAEKFGIAESVVSLLLIVFLVFGGGFLWIDAVARGVAPDGYYVPALIFGIAVFLIQFLADLPFSLYDTFAIEERYGFNQTTPRLFLSDTVKSLAVSALIGIPVYLGILWFMVSAGSLWWLRCWLFLQVVQILLLIAYPTVIAPLFNKFTPIKEGDLKERIVALLKKVAFPFTGIFVMDGSKRSRHSNAYFAGIGKKKRIVLYDTLVEQMNTPQILAVLGHELGHFTKRHVRKRLILQSLLALGSLYALGQLFQMELFYQGLGFPHPSNYAALVIFGLCASALSFVFTPLFSKLSRSYEYKADEFAVKHLDQPEALKDVIVLLSKENLANLHPHPWYSFFHYTHPSPVERIQAIDEAIARFGPH
jgi:STE24 endopeptidase